MKNKEEKQNDLHELTEEQKASQERYNNLLDDALFSVAIFYSQQMSDFLQVCGQIDALTVISILLLIFFSAAQGFAENRWSDFKGYHSLWYDVLKSWLSTVCRTLAFLSVNFIMILLKDKLQTTEHTVLDIFIHPIIILFLLIAAIKYISCISIEHFIYAQ